MPLKFHKPPVGQPVTVHDPIAAPDDPHPTRGTWVNEGVAAYREVYGEAEYQKNRLNDLPFPIPEDTPAERRAFRWRTRKTQMLFGYKALVTGRRGTHMFGVGARGTVTVVAKPEFPDHEFFTPGRVFPCRLRHANASFKDDGCTQVRACSLKFADARIDSPFDIAMNTGVTQAFWNFDTFMRFAFARLKCDVKNWEPQKEWMRLLPGGLIGSVESLRMAPRSFAEMLYHSAVAFPFHARDGRTYYAKYRIVPLGLERESGFLAPEFQRKCWIQPRLPSEDRPIQYLADEYRARLARGPIEYALQFQLREFDPNRDSREFFNCVRIWDPRVHPWRDLATIRITEPLSDYETERTRMWLGHQPPSLGLLDSHSDRDYNSLAWVRYYIYPASQFGRRFLRFLGLQRQLSREF